MPIREATPEDVASVLGFLSSGKLSGELWRTVFGMTRNQTFFVTRGGLLGLGHLDTKPGDQVWILRGGRVPFTLRAQNRDKERLSDSIEHNYTLVGRTYVQGIMQGEALRSGSVHSQGEEEVQIH